MSDEATSGGSIPEHGVVETTTARVWLGDDGIIRAVVVEGAVRLTLEHAIENVAALEKVADGVPRPLLSDVRAATSASKEHRDYFAGDTTARFVKAGALLVSSPVTRVLGNFFLKVSRPLGPTRLFSSEREAISWLLQFVEETKEGGGA